MQVRGLVARAKAAGAQWRASPFSQRRQLLKIMLKFIVENQEEICRWAAGYSAASCSGLCCTVLLWWAASQWSLL